MEAGEPGIIGFLPMLVMQVVYAIFVAQVAKRTNKNVPLYVVLSLIPLVGVFFLIYVMWSTALRVLDSINELKAAQSAKPSSGFPEPREANRR